MMQYSDSSASETSGTSGISGRDVRVSSCQEMHHKCGCRHEDMGHTTGHLLPCFVWMSLWGLQGFIYGLPMRSLPPADLLQHSRQHRAMHVRLLASPASSVAGRPMHARTALPVY